MDNALTVDTLARRTAQAGGSQEDLKQDDIFEMHTAKIALYEYKTHTNNYSGADFISGKSVGLLPSKLAQKAADFANASKKLQNALGDRPFKGAAKGKGGDEPMKCYYCQKLGHIARDCPQKKADIDAGIVTPKAKGKGRPGARARAKIVAKIEEGDDA